MSQNSEVNAEAVESVFGQSGAAFRFANFCNAVLVAEVGNLMPSLPVLSEKPGADGSFDGEWEVPVEAVEFSNLFARVGWNVFQFKARGISGSSRKKAVSDVKSSVKGAFKNLVARLQKPKELNRYVLFTNLQLGLETESTTERGAILSKDRGELEKAIREGSSDGAIVQIVDAAQLAALVNRHPALRLTYFSPNVARSWEEKWDEERASKDYKLSVPLVGREKEVEQVSAWISDQSVKVIAICGPSGMGKTRLALETTRRDRFRTTVVDIVTELERTRINSLGTSAQPRIVIVEDPTEQQAIRLAKQAVSTNRVKLIFTFPSEAKTPQLKLTEHESVKQMALQSLDREQSRRLLDSTGTDFDTAARDWVIQQAGGVPEILLSTAELGPSLRDKSGDLKKRLTEVYRKRIQAELEGNAIGILRLLSILHWVSVSGDKPDLPILIDTVGKGFNVSTVLDHIRSLEQMGHLRRRGDHVSVIPPLFAAALSEEQFAGNAPAVCELFDRLSDPSRKRLLERVITTDLSEQSSFWDHVFDAELRTTERVVANLDLLDYLARAIPARTARFLETQIEPLADLLGPTELDPRRGILLETLRELTYTGESCAAGMRLLQVMALREEWQKEPSSATKLFCECFIDWYFAFPLAFQSREQWVRRMLAAEESRERLLATHAVVMATNPPRTLSGYTLNARRLGESPLPQMWKDVHDYVERLVQLRFELTQDRDPRIAGLAREGFIGSFQETHISPDPNVRALEKFMEWQLTGKLNEDERKIRQVVHWIESRYAERSRRPNQLLHAEKWASVLQRLAALSRRLDEGPFQLRLRIALGRAFEYDWEEVGGKRVYGFEKRCQVLAEEAVANPILMTDEAWALLKDRESYNAHTFIIALGAADGGGKFLAPFEGDIAQEHGSHNYGLYLSGMQQRDPEIVDRLLDELATRPDVERQSLLKPIQFTGPTPGNRRRLLQLIAARSIQSISVASMFTVGGWLNGLPPAEVRTILEFIATGPPEWPRWILEILSLYLHSNKPLPAELLPIAEDALQKVNAVDDHVVWNCDQVAIGITRTDVEKAFDLLRTQILAFNQAVRRTTLHYGIWTPFHRHGTNDFWEVMRAIASERAYRELLVLQGAESKSEMGLVLDLEKHCEVLLKIAQEADTNALFFSRLVSGAQGGFFPFAYGLMQLFPGNESLVSNLGSAVVYQLGLGFGDGDYSQALAKVETEIKSKTTPPQVLPWLHGLKGRIDGGLKEARLRQQSDYYLGWD